MRNRSRSDTPRSDGTTTGCCLLTGQQSAALVSRVEPRLRPTTRIKIGKSLDSEHRLSQRIRAAAKGSGGSVELLALHSGYTEAEQAVHLMLNATRDSPTEWFLPTDDVLARVEHVNAAQRSRHGETMAEQYLRTERSESRLLSPTSTEQ